MAELPDELDRIAVEATSPAGAISAHVAGRSVTVRSRPGANAG